MGILPGLKVLMVKRGRSPGVTRWSEDPLGGWKSGWRQFAALFPGMGAPKPGRAAGLGAGFLVQTANRCAVVGPLSWDRPASVGRPSPGGTVWVCALAIPEIWSFQTPKGSDTDRVNTGVIRKPVKQLG